MAGESAKVGVRCPHSRALELSSWLCSRSACSLLRTALKKSSSSFAQGLPLFISLKRCFKAEGLTSHPHLCYAAPASQLFLHLAPFLLISNTDPAEISPGPTKWHSLHTCFLVSLHNLRHCWALWYQQCMLLKTDMHKKRLQNQTYSGNYTQNNRSNCVSKSWWSQQAQHGRVSAHGHRRLTTCLSSSLHIQTIPWGCEETANHGTPQSDSCLCLTTTPNILILCSTSPHFTTH